jgi:hypothetical protein
MEKAIAQRREAKKKKLKAPDPSMAAPETLERDADELDVQFERVLVQMGVRRKTRHAMPPSGPEWSLAAWIARWQGHG